MERFQNQYQSECFLRLLQMLTQSAVHLTAEDRLGLLKILARF